MYPQTGTDIQTLCAHTLKEDTNQGIVTATKAREREKVQRRIESVRSTIQIEEPLKQLWEQKMQKKHSTEGLPLAL